MASLTKRFTLRHMITCTSPLIVVFFAGLIVSLLINRDLFFAINQLAPNQKLLWLNLTHLGDALVAVTLFSLFFANHRKWLWSLSVSLVLSTIVVQGLKHAFDLPRPPAVVPMDQIYVLVPTSLDPSTLDTNIDYEKLVDDRADTLATWLIIKSDLGSDEARYWVPRMNGVVTKQQFGLAFSRETLDLNRGTYEGIYRPSTRSFPSGHTTTIICALTLLILYLQKMKWSWVLTLTGLIIASTRIAVGVHWPIDIAVGGLIGWAIAIFSAWIIHNRRFKPAPIVNFFIVLLPLAASISLLARPAIYPEIAGLEILIGIAGLLVTSLTYWKFYRERQAL